MLTPHGLVGEARSGFAIMNDNVKTSYQLLLTDLAVEVQVEEEVCLAVSPQVVLPMAAVEEDNSELVQDTIRQGWFGPEVVQQMQDVLNEVYDRAVDQKREDPELKAASLFHKIVKSDAEILSPRSVDTGGVHINQAVILDALRSRNID